MKMYKVLRTDMKSPYEKFEYKLNKSYFCNNFDSSENECGPGFHCVPLEGLAKWFYNFKHHRVFEVEVGGKERIFNSYEQRYERITLIKEIFHDELKSLAIAKESQLGYRLSEVLLPINPFIDIKENELTKTDISNLNRWTYIRDTVDTTIYKYTEVVKKEDKNKRKLLRIINDAVQLKLHYNKDITNHLNVIAIDAYAAGLFPKSNKWNLDNMGKGASYPYQCLLDLWYRGFVPYYSWKDDSMLIVGKNEKIVYYKERYKL